MIYSVKIHPEGMQYSVNQSIFYSSSLQDRLKCAKDAAHVALRPIIKSYLIQPSIILSMGSNVVICKAER